MFDITHDGDVYRKSMDLL